MLWNLSLLIMLPLVELLTALTSKNHFTLHRILLAAIIAISLELSLSLPISEKIYTIDFGFVSLKFMCDIYSYFFGILVNIVWFLTNLYSQSYIKLNLARSKVSHFFTYLSLSIFTVFGSAYAADLWTLFIFYILLILFTAPLISQETTPSSLKARALYLTTHLSSAICLLFPAIFTLQYFTGSVDFTSHPQLVSLGNDKLAAILLFLFTFGISKNCILPFHNWITRTTIAPTPISGLLHSVAAVKSGSIAAIKIVVYVFGLEYTRKLTSNFFTGGWIFYLCGLTAVYAAYRAFKTTNVKKRFAYSTISQLSYILSSVMIATPLALMGAVLHIISHSLSKIVLFYISGIFTTVYQAHSTAEAARIAPNIRTWIACLGFCGASIIGIPLLPGSYGKDFMLISEFQTHHYASLIFLVTGSLINILYIYPIIKAAFFNKKDPAIKSRKIPPSMRLAILSGVAISVLISLFISDIVKFFETYNV